MFLALKRLMISNRVQVRIRSIIIRDSHDACRMLQFQTPIEFYNKVSSVYSQLNAPSNNAAVNVILKYLPLTPDDIVLDIGGGTGDVAHGVWKQAQLKNPILCVDPSEGMLEAAKEKDGIETFRATAEEFFSSEMVTSKPFTKVIISGCAHLFTDREAVYSSLKTRLKLPANGTNCVVVYFTFLSPLVPAAAEHFRSGFRQKEIEVDTKAFEKVGLKWKLVNVVETLPIRKSDWYTFHRKRMFLCIEPLSDVEIEKGIRGLEEEYGSQEVLDIDVHLTVAILECS